MNIGEVLRKDEFKNIFSEVETFAHNILCEYNDKLNNQKLPKDGKEIFDAVWGTIEFNSAEICLLDSPLLQRLRRIKQLGLASYVYCGADYSRFNHTLGVVFLADKMASKIKRKTENYFDKDKYRYNPVQIARLAAIFHDVGHMVLSHASEYYYASEVLPSRTKEIKTMLIAFRRETSSKASLHEILSVLIVNTREVRRLLLLVWKHFEDIKLLEDDEIDKIIEYISCLIIGVASDRFILPYSQIINGPIDADKCDYLSRDSHVTKVPVAVDIFRLIQKLRVVEVETIDFPNIWVDTPMGNFYKMALMHSAQKALGQLLIARSIMFESMYYHQKVVIAESMLRDVIKYFDSIGCSEFSDFSKILKLTDDIFSDYLPSIINLSEEQKSLHDTKNSISLLRQINRRELYKRVACLAFDNIVGEDLQKNKFIRDVVEFPTKELRESFIESIADEYNTIKKLNNVETSSEISEFSIVEFPSQTIDIKKIEMPIDFGNGEVKMSKEVFQSETWMQSREIRKKEHYLVTGLYDRELVYLALEKAIYLKYGLQLTSDAYICSKFSKEQINRQKNTLFEKGYYKNAIDLLPYDIIYSLIDRNLLRSVSEKFKTYEGVKGYTVSEEAVTDFLKQLLFYSNDKNKLKLLLDGVLRLLIKAVYIDRGYFSKHVGTLFDKIKQETENDIIICRLGGALDSSAHISYYFNDIEKIRDNIKIFDNLSSVLSSITDTASIVFFDDGAYSGNQVISIFQELMGVSKEQRATKEHHVDELSGEEKSKLQNQKIIIAYLCFNPKNEEYIKSELGKLDLANVRIEYITDMSEKLFDSKDIFITEEQNRIVKECLSEIGKSILYSRRVKDTGELKESWNNERIESSCLGYNDAEQMIILKSSVPTYTITPFWEYGKYNGSDWKPLFLRTLKKD